MVGLTVPSTLQVIEGLEVSINTAQIIIYYFELNFFSGFISGVKQLRQNVEGLYK